MRATIVLLLTSALAGGAASGVAFAADADADAGAASTATLPVVTAVRPNSGSTGGSSPVVIEGRHLDHVKRVMFGREAATGVTVLSAHRLSLYAPQQGHGTVRVRVTTSAGTSGYLKGKTQYTYVGAHDVGSFPTQSAPVPGSVPAPQSEQAPVATSCPTSTVCYSVGAAGKKPSSGSAMVEVRNGASQSAQLLPLPDDPNETRPSADLVDCAAVGSCVAVVDFDQNGDGSALDTLSGGTWTTYDALPPGGKPGSVNTVAISGVSCGAPGECTAVGSYGYDDDNKSTALIYTLHAGAWSVAALFPKATAGDSGADYVSCPTATWCAVHAASGRDEYLVTLANGKQTNHVMPAAPTGYLQEILNLDCAAVGQCVMVSEKTNYFVRYDAGKFTRVFVPAQLDAKAGSHDDSYADQVPLSCPTVSTCFATGSYQAANHPYAEATRSVVVRLDGSKITQWTMPEAQRGKYATSLDGLSCATTTYCVAIGTRGIFDHQVEGRSEVFSDGVWTPGVLASLSGQPSNSDLIPADVDCPAVQACTIVGSYTYNAEHARSFAYNLSHAFVAVQH